MGRSVNAIAYGVVMNKKLAKMIMAKLQDEDGDWPGITNRRDQPDAFDSMRNRDVLGFVVLIEAHNGCHPDARNANLPTIPLGDTAAVLEEIKQLAGPETLAEAHRKWVGLVTVAKRHRVVLSEPTLVFTTVSTA